MDMDWLNLVNPVIDQSKAGYTSLAAIFDAMDLDSEFTAIQPKVGDLESVIATVVADGMSRVGYDINGGLASLADFQPQVVERYGVNLSVGSPFSTSLYKGRAYLPPPESYDASNSTLLRWEIYIAGYGYSASDVGYQLALTLFFVYSAFALAHIVYRVSKSKISNAWEDFIDLLVLAQNSPPATHALDGTSTGIKKGSTFKKRAMIRVVDTEPLAPEHDRLALVFDGGDGWVQAGLQRRAQTDDL